MIKYSIRLVDVILTGITTPNLRRPGSNDNKGVHQIRQNSRTGASLWDSLVSYSKVDLTYLASCSRCILQQQPTEVVKLFKSLFNWYFVLAICQLQPVFGEHIQLIDTEINKD